MGLVGPMLTSVIDGTAFSMVTDAVNGVPASVPSLGVTSQVMTSPFAKPDERVVPVPKMELPFFQA